MNQEYFLDIKKRLRRNRQSQNIRNMFEQTKINLDNLVQPIFVIEGNKNEEIESMPDIQRIGIENLEKEINELYSLGIKSVALFPKVEDNLKDESGSYALDENGLVLRAIKAIKSVQPDMIVIADIALDPYTTHGHDGILTQDKKQVDNDKSLIILCQMAVLNAKAGADYVAPSGMMDAQVAFIRMALDDEKLCQTGIIAYSAKYASCLYNPFRDALGSLKENKSNNENSKEKEIFLKDKKTYQLNPANTNEALLEIKSDEEESADAVMIKPASLYLDIIAKAKQITNLPIVAYQVSGEYSQICGAAKLGWLDKDKCALESLISIKRAGADIILTYFAKHLAKKMQR